MDVEMNGAGSGVDGIAVIVVLVMVGMIALMVVLALAAHKRAKQHRIALVAFASERGWQIIEADKALPKTYRAQPFNARGDNPVAKEILYGTFRGRPARSFLYQYTTTSSTTNADGSTSTSTTTHVFHVVSLTLPVALPALSLTREGVGSRLAKKFGRDDIQFESEEFNKAWRVLGADKRFAHGVIHPQMIDLLMRPAVRGRPLHVDGNQLFTWSPGKHDLGAIEGRLTVLSDVVDRIPRFVWQDHGHDPAATVV